MRPNFILFIGIMISHFSLLSQTTPNFPIGKWSVSTHEPDEKNPEYVRIFNSLAIQFNADNSIDLQMDSNSEVNNENMQLLLKELNNAKLTKYCIDNIWVYLIMSSSNKQLGSIRENGLDESVLEFYYYSPEIFHPYQLLLRKIK